MDIKLKSKLKRIFIGSLVRQIIIMGVLSVIIFACVMNLFVNGEYHRVNADSYTYIQKELISESEDVSLSIYRTTCYLKGLRNGRVTQENINNNISQEDLNYNTKCISYLIVDNKVPGKIYTNEYKLLENKADFEKYIRDNSYCYYKVDSRKTFSPYVERHPEHKEYLSEARNYTEYYWYSKDNSRASDVVEGALYPFERAKKQVVYLAISVPMLILIIILNKKKYDKLGKQGMIDDIKKSILYRGTEKSIKLLGFSGVYKKLILIMILTIIFIFSWFALLHDASEIFLIYCIAYIIIVPTYVFLNLRYFNEILNGVEKIASGEFFLTIEEKKDKDLAKLARNINSIKEGYSKALEEQIKNERLKSELISNVSHDLKTPLTSIVTYLDLLQKEDICNEDKEDYIKILNAKAQKLKVLIEDLFEVSKINSGKVELNIEKVDIIQLIYQALGECSNYYKEKNIIFKVKTFENSIMLQLDGKRMSRVFENLISNVLKYSLENTRVYIDINQKVNELEISFKNISECEMDFDENEIFERFKRGDESRNSDVEGSGLGLAISKSIVELHGGTMHIEKEGDLFKVFINFKI